MPRPHYYGVILAGGRGTRFWPRSRRRKAKQVLNVFGELSLIQTTVTRLAPLIPHERLWVVTNALLRDEIVRQLPEIPARQILAEPVQRNTAATVGLAAHVLHSLDRDAVMGVFPSDHVIAKEGRYRQMLRPAFRAAAAGKIAVLGIAPRWAETGYGYIEFPPGTRAGAPSAAKVLKFHEKPKIAAAKRYVKSGRFFWNAGMFFWRADVLLEELRNHIPKTAAALDSLPAFTDSRFTARLKQAFPLCDDISIDFAVLEPAGDAGKVVGLACDDIGWNDVGSWDAVYELLPRDGSRNAARSTVISADSFGNYIDAEGKLVALLGVNDLIIVDTTDALLIADRKRAQQVGDIVKLLEQNSREDLL